MRINKMITKRKILDLLIKFSNLFFKEMYRDRSGEFVCGYWGLKGKHGLTCFSKIQLVVYYHCCGLIG